MTETVELAEVVETAAPIVDRIVWATLTTVSPSGEPRSRIMHPVWDWTAEVPTALVSARRTPIKVRHLAAEPRVSCSYWDPTHATTVIDAEASWLEPAELTGAWDWIRSQPEPIGFDPAIIWPGGVGDPGVAFIRLVARRIVAAPTVGRALLWPGPRS